MVDIKEQKLLYHLTDINNLPSILEKGLLPRSRLDCFTDIANAEILDGRKKLELDKYVPFHFFALNPFDEGVQKSHTKKEFVLVAVRRTLAQVNNWKIIPRHPLANADIELLDFDKGMGAINWNKMNERNYLGDEESRSVCMAECLSPKGIKPSSLSFFFVKTEQNQQQVRQWLKAVGLEKHVNVNAGMFASTNND